MQRIPLTPRPNWQHIVEQQGHTFHTLENGHPYWDESAAYEFTAAEIDTLESAANELQGMCLAAAQHIIDHRRYADLSIPPAAIPVIEAAWNAEPPALYGRFDLIWSGAHSGDAPKLLEYNADTPTSLLEAAVIQWNWLEEVGPHLPTHSFLPPPPPGPTSSTPSTKNSSPSGATSTHTFSNPSTSPASTLPGIQKTPSPSPT